jgi:hypothetical protein
MRSAIAVSTIAPGGPTTSARPPRPYRSKTRRNALLEGHLVIVREMFLRLVMRKPRWRGCCQEAARSASGERSGNCATGVGQGMTLVPPELLDLFNT